MMKQISMPCFAGRYGQCVFKSQFVNQVPDFGFAGDERFRTGITVEGANASDAEFLCEHLAAQAVATLQERIAESLGALFDLPGCA